MGLGVGLVVVFDNKGQKPAPPQGEGTERPVGRQPPGPGHTVPCRSTDHVLRCPAEALMGACVYPGPCTQAGWAPGPQGVTPPLYSSFVFALAQGKMAGGVKTGDRLS